MLQSGTTYIHPTVSSIKTFPVLVLVKVVLAVTWWTGGLLPINPNYASRKPMTTSVFDVNEGSDVYWHI